MIVRYDSDGRIWAGQDLFPQPRAWSFNFENVAAYSDSYTDVIDLGEGFLYVFLIARKIGNSASGGFLEIQSSVNGERWAPAALAIGGEYITNYDALISRAQLPAPVYYIYGRPIGRYVRVLYHNGGVVQSNLVLDLWALGGI